MIYIGIDFGAANLKAVSVSETCRVNKLKLNRNQLGGDFTPNVILYDKIKERVEIKIGNAAKKSLDAENKVSHIKPKLTQKNWTKKIASLARTVSVGDVVKDIFCKLWQEIAQKFSRTETFDVAITVPVSYSELQKKIIRQAALDAGIPVTATVTEAFAAIFADEDFGADEQTILIFDFGASTLDLSLCRIERCEENLTVTELAAGGLKFGGLDIDNALYEKILCRKYGDELKACLRDDNGTVLVDVKNLVEALKEEIFRNEQDEASDSVIDMRGQMYEFTLTREEILAVLAEMNLREKIFEVLNELFDDACLDKSELTKIRLVGGSSTIEPVREILTDYFDMALDEPDADEIYMSVATGAAKYRYFVETTEKVTMKNVIPFSIGLSDGKIFKRLIKRNELTGFVTPFKPLPVEENTWRVAVYQSFANDFVLPLDDEKVIYIGDVELDKNLYDASETILYKMQTRPDGQIALKFFQLSADDEAPALIEEKIVSVGD